MIEPDHVICTVTRIYATATDESSECIYMAPGDLFMECKEVMGRDVGCTPVMMTPDVVKQFKRMCWSTDSALSVMRKYCTPVDDDTDARLRAMFALNGGVVIGELSDA